MVLAAWLALASSTCLASAVLPPSAGDALSEAFAQMEPEWILESASVQKAEVEATLCRGGECAQLRLREPFPECAGLALDAWCIEIIDGRRDGLDAALSETFGPHRHEDFWQVPERSKGELGLTQEVGPSRGLSILLALLTLFGPLLLGLGAGLVWRRFMGRVRSGIAGAAIIAVSLLVPALWPASWLIIGIYDGLLILGVAALGFLWTGHRWFGAVGLKEGLLLGAGLLFALGLAEGACRLWLPTPPAFPPPENARLLLEPAASGHTGGTACKALFPGQFPELVNARRRVPSRPLQVLHVGDSMLEGVGVAAEERFVARLNGFDHRVGHSNAGFSGTGPAHYLLTTRRWLAESPAHRVVWYLFPYNDLDNGLAAGFGCCAGRSLLTFEATGVVDNCQEWEVGQPGNRFLRSPSPYLLRVATRYSWLAGHLTAAHVDLVRERPQPVPLAESVARLSLVLETAREELARDQIPFFIVLMPYRGRLERESDPALAARREAILSLCLGLELTCLDGEDPLAGLMDRGQIARAFISEPVWDYHLSSLGHELFAEWLQRVLPLGDPDP